MEDIVKLFKEVCNIMEKDDKGAKLAAYSIAIVGLTTAIRRVRPFSRFSRPSDVPSRFLQERRVLDGSVVRIEPNGALLIVKHKPLLPIGLNSSKFLPVSIRAVDVSGNGISWLQSVVVGHKIKFIPIERKLDCLECEVVLPEVKKNQLNNLNLGEALVEIGFGTVSSMPMSPNSKDPNYKYYLTLKHAEQIALKKRLGYKYYIKPTKAFLILTLSKLNELAFRALNVAIAKASTKGKAPVTKKLTVA